MRCARSALPKQQECVVVVEKKLRAIYGEGCWLHGSMPWHRLRHESNCRHETAYLLTHESCHIERNHIVPKTMRCLRESRGMGIRARIMSLRLAGHILWKRLLLVGRKKKTPCPGEPLAVQQSLGGTLDPLDTC